MNKFDNHKPELSGFLEAVLQLTSSNWSPGKDNGTNIKPFHADNRTACLKVPLESYTLKPGKIKDKCHKDKC